MAEVIIYQDPQMFLNLSPGSYNVRLSSAGYRTVWHESVPVIADGTTSLMATMNPAEEAEASDPLLIPYESLPKYMPGKNQKH